MVHEGATAMTRDEAFALWASKHNMADGLPWETDRKVLLAVFTAGWDAHEEAGKQVMMFAPSILEVCIKAEDIYSVYPRHAGRGAAIKAIEKAMTKVDVATLLDAVQAYAAAVKTWPPTARYTCAGVDTVPHPATWFNQERWTDDRAEWVKGAVKHHQSQFGQKYT